MRIETNTTALKAAVDAVNTVMVKRPGPPILANVLLSFDGETLRVVGTNLDVRRTRTLGADGESGSVTVGGDVLKKALQKFPKNTALSLCTETDANGNIKLRLRAGKANLALSTLPAEDFPLASDADEMDAEGSASFYAPHFRNILARTKLAISNEETRYYLNGVYLDTSSNDATFVATDGHRMSVYQTGVPVQGSSVIIPKLAIYTAYKALYRRTDSVTIRWRDGRVRIELDGDVIDTKTVDGAFPDYPRVIPPHTGGKITSPVNNLKNALDRVTVVKDNNFPTVKVDCNGSVDLTCTDPENGTASERVDGAEYEGGEMEVGFNSAYVTDFMAVMAGDNVEIQLSDPASPCRIYDAECPQFLGVLMPRLV